MLKGGSLSNGDRYNFLNVSFWRRFKRENNIDIEYRDFMSIIDVSNRKIKEKVCNNVMGFKLPENLGYLAISAYKPKARKIDFNKTKKLGVTVYHTNFHSNGMDARIMWYTHKIAICRNIGQYKFVPDREFTHLKSSLLRSGKKYNIYSYDDFRMKRIRTNLDKLFY